MVLVIAIAVLAVPVMTVVVVAVAATAIMRLLLELAEDALGIVALAQNRCHLANALNNAWPLLE